MWLPLVKAGIGTARVSIPVVSKKAGFTSITSGTAYIRQFQVAAGINYVINLNYLVFTEAAYQQYAKTTLLMNQSFRVNAFRVGISTAL